MVESRPAKYSYSFIRVLWFPVRLLIPPDSGGAVKVRGFTVVPPLKIQLYDVIDGKHLPPLSSTDFEEYLRFQEHSVENLYFIRWLSDYSKKYQAQITSANPEAFNRELALSYARAKATFFSSKSIFAINVEAKNAILPPGAHYAPPSALDGARDEVEAMLRESLNNYITTRAQGNASFIHLMSVCIFGILCTLSGLAPILVQIYRGEGAGVRSIRLACIAPFWIGLVAFLGAANGVCPIVWMFGEGRQLRGYELTRPVISKPLSHTTMMPQQSAGDNLSKMELGFPSHAAEASEGDSNTWGRSVTIATAVTLDFRTDSPSPSTHSNISKPPVSQPLIHSSSPGSTNELPLSPLSPLATTLISPTSAGMSSTEISYAPIGSATSPISPFGTHDMVSHAASDPEISPFESIHTLEDAYIPELRNAAQKPRLPRRPQCSRSLWTLMSDLIPKRPKTWAFQLLGFKDTEADADEFGGTTYQRPRAFAPMTSIESTIIKRSNWEVIARSVAIASVITAALTAGLYAVPMKHH